MRFSKPFKTSHSSISELCLSIESALTFTAIIVARSRLVLVLVLVLLARYHCLKHLSL